MCKRHAFWSESMKERDESQDLGVDGSISKWILGKQGADVSQDRGQRRAVPNTVMNLRIPLHGKLTG